MRRCTGPELHSHQPRRSRGERGIQLTHCPALQQSEMPVWLCLGGGRAQFSVAVWPESCGSPADGLFQHLPQARPFHSGVPPCGGPHAPLSVAAFESSLGTLWALPRRGGRQRPEGPTQPSACHWAPGTSDAGAAGADPGTRPRCSRTVPFRAATLQLTVLKLPSKDGAGALLLLCSPGPRPAGLRGAAAARLAPHQQPPPH